MSLSKVRFSLFCIAFEELTAHLQVGICPSAQSKASYAPVLVVGQKVGRSTESPWSLIRVKAASPASKQSLSQIPCLTQSVQYLRN